VCDGGLNTKNRCAGLAVVLVSLVAFCVTNADIQFNGVIDPKMNVTRIDSVKLTSPDTTILTPDWFAENGVLDTLAFVGVTAWPETLTLCGFVNGLPAYWTIPHLRSDTWYVVGFGLTAPYVKFYGDYGVEESKPATMRQPHLGVSPSVVTGQMTIRLQPVGTTRPAVTIHDAVGNVVRSLPCATGTDGAATATWNREDDRGCIVPEGVYFCGHANSDVVAVRKVLVAR
jgi:hypothetical protein